MSGEISEWEMPELPDITAIELDALEVWVHQGVRCVIRAGYCCLNGYARLPKSMRDWWANEDEAADVLEAHYSITYGPDEDGFVGFDTAHHGDWWAADDLVGTIPEEGMMLANTFAKINSKGPYSRRWTRERLHEEVELLATQIAALAGELDLMMDNLEDVKRNDAKEKS